MAAMVPETFAAAVPEPRDQIVRRALAPDPEARTITTQEIAQMADAG